MSNEIYRGGSDDSYIEGKTIEEAEAIEKVFSLYSAYMCTGSITNEEFETYCRENEITKQDLMSIKYGEGTENLIDSGAFEDVYYPTEVDYCYFVLYEACNRGIAGIERLPLYLRENVIATDLRNSYGVFYMDSPLHECRRLFPNAKIPLSSEEEYQQELILEQKLRQEEYNLKQEKDAPYQKAFALKNSFFKAGNTIKKDGLKKARKSFEKYCKQNKITADDWRIVEGITQWTSQTFDEHDNFKSQTVFTATEHVLAGASNFGSGAIDLIPLSIREHFTEADLEREAWHVLIKQLDNGEYEKYLEGSSPVDCWLESDKRHSRASFYKYFPNATLGA